MQPNQKGWYIILIWNPLIDLSGASNRFFVTPDFTEPISARTHTHTHTRIYIYIYIFSTSHEPHEAIFHSFIHERTKHSVRHDSRSCCCVGGNVAYCTVIVMHIYIYMILFCDICKKTCNISVIQNVYSSVQYLHHTRLLQTAGWLMLLIPKFTYIVTNQRELSERNQ